MPLRQHRAHDRSRPSTPTAKGDPDDHHHAKLVRRSSPMILATTQFAEWDRFWSVFSTGGAEKRAEHGCKGALVFRDDAAPDRVWAIFDWDDAGWNSFVSDPTVPAVMKDAGHLVRPYTLRFHGAVEA
jgi:quinol monooxygenase YgiN